MATALSPTTHESTKGKSIASIHTPRIERVGVIGCGVMGSGIAEVCAAAGMAVDIVESDPGRVEAGRENVRRALQRAVARGRETERHRDEILERLSFGHSFDALGSCDLVVEAVAEDANLKLQVFNEIDAVARPEALLASNTSSIPIMKLAMATSRPDTVVGMHFFNPAPVMPLVELVPSLATSDETLRQSREFLEGVLGKRVIQARDRAGFIVNALLIPYILAAIRMMESGFATARDIDAGMVDGCNHPMGPLALADLIGLDTTKSVAESLYAEFKESLYAPPPLLCRMVEAGLLGRKSGQGFYRYDR